MPLLRSGNKTPLEEVTETKFGAEMKGWTITYAGDTMNPNNSVASGGDFTWTKKSMRLYQKWGDCVGFKADKGQLNTTINWAKIKKDLKVLGHLNVTYKEEWLKYFNLKHSDNGGYAYLYQDATVENPFNLDYEEFTELWRPEIEKWLEKHPQKVKKSNKEKEFKDIEKEVITEVRKEIDQQILEDLTQVHNKPLLEVDKDGVATINRIIEDIDEGGLDV